MSKATNDSTGSLLLETVGDKLTQTVDLWFDDNESQFMKWSDCEIVIFQQRSSIQDLTSYHNERNDMMKR